MINLFKKKRFTKNLIYLEKGNIRFTSKMKEVQSSMEQIMLTSGIFCEDFYRDVYKEYVKHYSVYDVVPTLLLYKLIFIFRKRNSNYRYTDSNAKNLIPSWDIYAEIPSLFKVPDYLHELMNDLLGKIEAYMPKDFDIRYFRRIFLYNYLKEWDIYLNNPGLYEAFLDLHIDALINTADPENKTIVKNIIERTLEEYDRQQ